jgi:hypothetical protein
MSVNDAVVHPASRVTEDDRLAADGTHGNAFSVKIVAQSNHLQSDYSEAR